LATCYNAAPSGSHASSIGEHARVLTADDGCNVADKAIRGRASEPPIGGHLASCALRTFPTVAALGLSVFELSFVEGLNILVAKFGPRSAVGSECGNGEVEKRMPAAAAIPSYTIYLECFAACS
jgi:hypothetical protein